MGAAGDVGALVEVLVDVCVGDCVGRTMREGNAVHVGNAVCVAVLVASGVGMEVWVGVCIGSGVFLCIRIAVAFCIGCGIFIDVGIDVCVGLLIAVDVLVDRADNVLVGRELLVGGRGIGRRMILVSDIDVDCEVVEEMRSHKFNGSIWKLIMFGKKRRHTPIIANILNRRRRKELFSRSRQRCL